MVPVSVTVRFCVEKMKGEEEEEEEYLEISEIFFFDDR